MPLGYDVVVDDNPGGRRQRGPNPLADVVGAVFDVIPAEGGMEALKLAGNALNAAGEAFEAGVGLVGDGLGNLAAAAADVAGDIEWSALGSVAGDVAGAAAEGLGDVAGAVLEGLGDLST